MVSLNEARKYEAQIVEGFCDHFDCDPADLLYFELVETDEGEG